MKNRRGERRATIELIAETRTGEDACATQNSEHLAEQANHVVGGDDAMDDTVLIYYGHHQQVVFVEELGDLAFLGVHAAAHQRLGDERLQRGLLFDQHDRGDLSRAGGGAWW